MKPLPTFRLLRKVGFPLLALLPSLAGNADDQTARPVAVQESKPGGLGFVAVMRNEQDFDAFCIEMRVPLPPKVGKTTYVIDEFLPNGNAEKAGIRKNDVLFKIAGVEITDAEKFTQAQARLFADQPVEIIVRRIKQAGKTKKWETVRIKVIPVERAEVDADLKDRENSIPPIVITGSGIHYNVIGLPELTIAVHNPRQIAVEAFEVDVECFDKFDEPVNSPGKDNRFKGISQSKLLPNATTRAKWQLSLNQNTTRATLWVSRVKLSDGTIWTQTRQEAANTDQLAPARLIE
jgi:hypothetical protein